MNEIILILRISIGTLFLSSSISKLLYFSKHVVIVEEYKILPKKFTKFFSRIEVSFELICSISLILGLLQPWVGAILLLLLIMYTIGIIVNLCRKRTNISCGCGGIAGDHNLSWVLAFRNLFLIGLIIFLIKNETTFFSLQSFLIYKQDISLIFNHTGIFSVLLSIFLILLMAILNSTFTIYRGMNHFLYLTKQTKERKI
ncbi:DoxX family membrane protein [Bacillus cereus]|uniref:MauE/DoxX family redox-associated membrane protein n=1 Tax=Bacillus TaxID=1386 RepID=UPI00054F1C3F|nr:MauE/DoxX family redox-associated membrane protein [Bacillus sp. UNC322MFChir4.1]